MELKSMRFTILELKGIGPQAAKALEKAGYYYAEELVPMDVKKVSKETNIAEDKLQQWKDYVALMKIKSIGPNYANLLHRQDVGIATAADLSKAQPDALLKKLIESNKKKRLVKVLPTLAKVQRWIETAKKK